MLNLLTFRFWFPGLTASVLFSYNQFFAEKLFKIGKYVFYQKCVIWYQSVWLAAFKVESFGAKCLQTKQMCRFLPEKNFLFIYESLQYEKGDTFRHFFDVGFLKKSAIFQNKNFDFADLFLILQSNPAL